MNHTDMGDELYDLYVLGILEPDQSEQIEAHLRENCEYCGAKLNEARRVAAAMAGMANQVQPPASLRRRVLASVEPPKRSNFWLYAAAGLAAACVAILAFSIWSRIQNQTLRSQLAAMRVERNELRSALELMSRPETRAVQFGNLENAPRGRVFVSKTGGVVFVGTRLPSLPENKTFELWVVPANGAAPQPAGVFRPGATGEAVDIASANVNASGAKAVAVSVEPLAGSNAPTTKPFLIVPLG
jgi:anti-sigma-K factor RskA